MHGATMKIFVIKIKRKKERKKERKEEKKGQLCAEALQIHSHQIILKFHHQVC
jgi:hypothetical protein